MRRKTNSEGSPSVRSLRPGESSLGSMIGNTNRKNLKDGFKSKPELVASMEAREIGWNSSPSNGIPKYDAERDKNCPIAKSRVFNERQRSRAIMLQTPPENATRKSVSLKNSSSSSSANSSTIEKRRTGGMPRLVPLKNVVASTMSSQKSSSTTFSKESIPFSRSGGPPSMSKITGAALSDSLILQRIVVRETLLRELHRLVDIASSGVTIGGMTSVLSELVELVKAIRYETLDIIEAIAAWKAAQPKPVETEGTNPIALSIDRPFCFRGMNYLLKLAHDLDFLDQHEVVVERFCFEFRLNPLAYRGGGHVITGREMGNSDAYLKNLLKSHYESGERTVDGIDISRLHLAEQVVQQEFSRVNRLARLGFSIAAGKQEINLITNQANSVQETAALEIKLLTENGVLNSGENAEVGVATNAPSSLDSVQEDAGNYSIDNNLISPKGHLSKSPTRQVGLAPLKPQQLRKQRIAKLRADIDELEAMHAHISEKISTLTTQQREYAEKKKFYDCKLLEFCNTGSASSVGGVAAQQSLAVEACMMNTKLTETTTELKALHRQQYFVGLDKRRKSGVLSKILSEEAEEKARKKLKKRIQEKISREGLLAALSDLDLQANGSLASMLPSLRTSTSTPTTMRSSIGAFKSGTNDSKMDSNSGRSLQKKKKKKRLVSQDLSSDNMENKETLCSISLEDGMSINSHANSLDVSIQGTNSLVSGTLGSFVDRQYVDDYATIESSVEDGMNINSNGQVSEEESGEEEESDEGEGSDAEEESDEEEGDFVDDAHVAPKSARSSYQDDQIVKHQAAKHGNTAVESTKSVVSYMDLSDDEHQDLSDGDDTVFGAMNATPRIVSANSESPRSETISIGVSGVKALREMRDLAPS